MYSIAPCCTNITWRMKVKRWCVRSEIIELNGHLSIKQFSSSVSFSNINHVISYTFSLFALFWSWMVQRNCLTSIISNTISTDCVKDLLPNLNVIGLSMIVIEYETKIWNKCILIAKINCLINQRVLSNNLINLLIIYISYPKFISTFSRKDYGLNGLSLFSI